MENKLFWLIIIFLVIDFMVERWLDFLNSKQYTDQLPEELKEIYDAKAYERSQSYARAKDQFGIITGTFGLVLILLMFFLGGFAWVDALARSISPHPILNALLFFGIFGLASDLVTLPFSIYSVFVIEERFGFNKTSPKTFVMDKLKGWLISAVVGGGLLSLIIWIYMLTNSWFWVLAWGVIAFFSVFLSMFYTSLILPLFNKQQPLEEGVLRTAIKSFSEKVKFTLDNIYVMDGSKRSSKANAFFSGMGPKKRIVLYDTLITDLDNDEITAVLAHEVGHYKKKHTMQGMVLSIVNTGIILFILSFFLDSSLLAASIGIEAASFHISLLVFGILYSPIGFLLGIGFNLLSRKNEYEADKFAAENYIPQPLGKALIKLSVKSLSNLRPHPLYVFFHYSHPTLLQRLNHLKKYE